MLLGEMVYLILDEMVYLMYVMSNIGCIELSDISVK